MVETQIVTPNDSEQIVVPDAVRAKFEKRRCSGEYERWLQRFARNCNPFTEIAKDEKLTAERIRQIYNEFFAPYLPEKSGLQRKHVCALHRTDVSFKRAERKFPTKLLEDMAHRVREQGHTISAVPRKTSTTGNNAWVPRKGALCINNMMCRVSHQKKKIKNSNGVLVRVGTNVLKKYSFFIFCLEVEDFDLVFYVIPVEILRDTALCIKARGKKRESVVFVLPLNKVRGNINFGWGVSREPKVDWRQYIDAWHLLELQGGELLKP